MPGGVAELYNIADLQSNHICYFELYRSMRARFKILDTIFMYIRFIISINKYDIVHLNPSLNKKAFVRDATLILLSRLFHKKVLIYWHGWVEDFEDKIKNRFIYSFLLKYSFKKVNACVVLGSLFKNKLISLGFQNPIYIEKNCAYNQFLLNENKEVEPRSLHTPIRLLFLSRIEKLKGVYIAIETARLLNEISPYKYELLIAGNGSEFVEAKKYIEFHKIPNVKFIGYVNGLKKHELLKSSDILLFPSYTEGLPIVILESMIYGIPVITRSVGGIPDIVRDKKNGFLTDSKDPKIFVELVLRLSNDIDFYQKISKTNATMAQDFSPERFKQRLKIIYDSL